MKYVKLVMMLCCASTMQPFYKAHNMGMILKKHSNCLKSLASQNISAVFAGSVAVGLLASNQYSKYEKLKFEGRDMDRKIKTLEALEKSLDNRFK